MVDGRNRVHGAVRVPAVSDKDRAHLYKKIKQGQYSFHAKAMGHTSLSVRDLIHKMLTVDPDRRASCAELLRHPWFSEDILHIPLATHKVLNPDASPKYGAPTGPHANPTEHDDYDTQVEGLPVDTTGDGIADAIGFDTTGDGNVDGDEFQNLDPGRIDGRNTPVDVATAGGGRVEQGISARRQFSATAAKPRRCRRTRSPPRARCFEFTAACPRGD